MKACRWACNDGFASGETIMPKIRKDLPENILEQLLFLSSNRCCICQTPLIVIHHIDGNPANNNMDNLAPLCPNCHTHAHSNSKLTRNLTPDRIKSVRKIWYNYCECRRGSQTTADRHGIVKMMTFVRTTEEEHGLPQYGWTKTFSVIHLDYKDMHKMEIIKRVFASSNKSDLITYLEAVKSIYARQLKKPGVKDKFNSVCNAFGVHFEELV
jgi:hypothetical protein